MQLCRYERRLVLVLYKLAFFIRLIGVVRLALPMRYNDTPQVFHEEDFRYTVKNLVGEVVIFRGGVLATDDANLPRSAQERPVDRMKRGLPGQLQSQRTH